MLDSAFVAPIVYYSLVLLVAPVDTYLHSWHYLLGRSLKIGERLYYGDLCCCHQLLEIGLVFT